MTKFRRKALVLTPVHHLPDVLDRLNRTFRLNFAEDKELVEIGPELSEVEIVITAPNRPKFSLDKEFFRRAESLTTILTVSTGANHIDLLEAEARGIEVVSLRQPEFRPELYEISSTAELALGLTIAAVRDMVPAARRGLDDWDYTRFRGRQMRNLSVGVIGLGRLGTMYAQFVAPLVKKVLYFDPLVNRESPERVERLPDLFRAADIVSIHASLSASTERMINRTCFAVARSDLVLVNTARGEIVNETDFVDFLKGNPNARAALDVVAGEETGWGRSELVGLARESDQVILTPHMGGTAQDAQEIAYMAALDGLETLLSSRATRSRP